MKERPLKVVICAGGTGGHLYPGISVAQALIKKDPDTSVLFFVSRKKLDADIIGRNGFRFSRISSSGFSRDLSLQSIKAFFMFGISFVQSFVRLLRFRPDALVTMGGYTGLSSVIAARVLRIPVVLHEQNVLPGAANRLASRFASAIAVSFDGSRKYFTAGKVSVTGNPLRQSILTADRQYSRKIYGFNDDKFTLLVIGGSQGAASINKAVSEMLPLMKDAEINILHVSGGKDFEGSRRSGAAEDTLKATYRVFPYIDDMSLALSASDLVVSRAGATALAEIAARGLPSVLVPYPYAAEKHQDLNAKVFEDAGAAVMLQDYSLSGKRLSDIIREMMSGPDKMKKMSEAARSLYVEGAAEKVTGLIYEAV